MRPGNKSHNIQKCVFKMGTVHKALFSVLILFYLSSSFAYTTSDMQKLIDDKKVFYNKKFRPAFYQNETTHVGIHFELIGIQDFEEVTEKFSVIGFVIMAWIDEHLKWDPKQYGGMESFSTEGGDFWKPPVVLVNAYDKIDSVGNSWNIFRYEHDGSSYVTPGAVFDASCTVDITYYPWDHQTCALVFLPWGYSAKEVTLLPIAENAGTQFYNGNGQWDLIRTDAYGFMDSAGSSVLSYEMTLRRKPRFVLVNVILPVVFMSFLNMIVFLIPTESGERMSYCLTVLLAIAVFLTLVGDTLPKTSDPMSLLSYYLLGVLVLSVLVIFLTVFSLRVYFRDEKTQVPGCLVALVRCMGCKCRGHRNYGQRRRRSFSELRSQNSRGSVNTHQSHGGKDSSVFVTNGYPPFQLYRGKWTQDIDEEFECDTHVPERNGKNKDVKKSRSVSVVEEEDEVTWKDVSYCLDVIFFLICLCLLITATAVLFALVVNKKEQDED